MKLLYALLALIGVLLVPIEDDLAESNFDRVQPEPGPVPYEQRAKWGAGMKACPLTLKEANAFVGELHRHHDEVTGHRFSFGAALDGKLVGTVIVGRPVAPKTEQYKVAEVTRLCTDGTPNACSFLYGAAAKICKIMGFKRIQTFILPTESGVSLKAAGWKFDGVCHSAKVGFSNRAGRKNDCLGPKHRWVKELNL